MKYDFFELENEYQELEHGIQAGGLSVRQLHSIIHRMEEIEEILIGYGFWDEE